MFQMKNEWAYCHNWAMLHCLAVTAVVREWFVSSGICSVWIWQLAALNSLELFHFAWSWEGGNSSRRKQSTLFYVLHLFADSSNNILQLFEQLSFYFLFIYCLGLLSFSLILFSCLSFFVKYILTCPTLVVYMCFDERS